MNCADCRHSRKMSQRQVDDELDRESPTLGTKLSLRHLPQVRELLNDGPLRCDIWGGLTSKSKTCRYASGFWGGVWAFVALLWGRNLDAEARMGARVLLEARRNAAFAEAAVPNGRVVCGDCLREHGQCRKCLSYRGACTTCHACGYQARVSKQPGGGWRVHCGRQPAHDLTFTELPARAQYELELCDGCRPHVGDWYERDRMASRVCKVEADVVTLDHMRPASTLGTSDDRWSVGVANLVAVWSRASARQCICDGSTAKPGNIPCHP